MIFSRIQDFFLELLFDDELNINDINFNNKIKKYYTDFYYKIFQTYCMKYIFDVIYNNFTIENSELIRNEINKYYISNIKNIPNFNNIKDIELRDIFIKYFIQYKTLNNIYNKFFSHSLSINNIKNIIDKEEDIKKIIHDFKKSNKIDFNTAYDTFYEKILLELKKKNLSKNYLIKNFSIKRNTNIESLNNFVKSKFTKINLNNLENFAKELYFNEYKKKQNNPSYILFSDKEVFKLIEDYSIF